MKYLIDTDWVIDHLRQQERITKRLEELASEGLAISVVSLAELYEGIYHSNNPAASEQALQQFLDPELTILGVDEESAKIFGKERGRLRALGTLIGDCHLLTGASALRHDLTILTNNRAHFERIDGLRLESIA